MPGVVDGVRSCLERCSHIACAAQDLDRLPVLLDVAVRLHALVQAQYGLPQLLKASFAPKSLICLSMLCPTCAPL